MTQQALRRPRKERIVERNENTSLVYYRSVSRREEKNRTGTISHVLIKELEPQLVGSVHWI